MALEQSGVLDSLTAIGLGRMENKERDLEGECLWVPASVKHHVANNSSLFIYGGVRVLPKVNVINCSDPRHRQVMGNAFNTQNRVAVTNNQIRSTNQAISNGQKTAQASIARKEQELRAQGYQKHHIASNKNQETKATVTEVFKKAGLDVKNSRENHIWLPSSRDLGTTQRTPHNGRHLKVVNKALKEKLQRINEMGEARGWGQSQYRQAVMSVIMEERSKLKDGVRRLHKDPNLNRDHSRPQSPPL